MAAFEELPEDEILDALRGHEYILDDIDVAVRANVTKRKCPECGGTPQPVLNSENPFDSDMPAFRYIARCNSCGCHFDHDTGLIRKPGAGSPYLRAGLPTTRPGRDG